MSIEKTYEEKPRDNEAKVQLSSEISSVRAVATTKPKNKTIKNKEIIVQISQITERMEVLGVHRWTSLGPLLWTTELQTWVKRIAKDLIS